MASWSETPRYGPSQPTVEDVEAQRRTKLVNGLRNQWLFSNDGITPARAAGMEWGNGEREWVNQQLAERIESWTV